MRLCHHSTSGRALVFPVGLQNTNGLVVSAETVNSGFDQDESEFGVFVLAVALEVLSDSYGLLDQHVEIFWDFWCKTVRLQDSQNLVTSNDLNLRDTMTIPQHNTNLRRCGTLSRKLADIVDDGLRGGLEPGGHGAGVWDRGGADAFAFAVKTAHLCDFVKKREN